MKNASKLRSKYYSKIIEINVPMRFYWADTDFDGVEFGEFNEISKWQLSLVEKCLEEIRYGINCVKFFKYMKKKHRAELEIIIDQMGSEEFGIPRAFVEAFYEEGKNEK